MNRTSKEHLISSKDNYSSFQPQSLVIASLKEKQKIFRQTQMNQNRNKYLHDNQSQQSTQASSSIHIDSNQPHTILRESNPNPSSLQTNHYPQTQYVQEYQSIIQTNMSIQELSHHQTTHNQSTNCICPEQRSRLINWLVYVHTIIDISPASLFLAIHLIDRVSLLQSIDNHQLQLLAIVALSIAAKYEEERVPQLDDLLKSTQYQFTKQAFLEMETNVLRLLNFQIEPTSSVYRWWQILILPKSQDIKAMSRYLIELAMLDNTLSNLKQSLLAQSSIQAAQHLYNYYHMSHDQGMPSGYQKEKEKEKENEIVVRIVGLLDVVQNSKYQQITSKFSSLAFNKVAQTAQQLNIINHQIDIIKSQL